jgi:hypothetical protein
MFQASSFMFHVEYPQYNRLQYAVNGLAKAPARAGALVMLLFFAPEAYQPLADLL